MAEALNAKETASFEELLMSNILTEQAIINLLDQKGILKKEEILEEVKRLNTSRLKAT
ncbi:MAG: hypothetical protein ACE5FZ_10210 [Nitrospiria bacterium]